MFITLDVQVYKGELNLEEGDNFHDRPPLELVKRKFRAAKITSYVAAVVFTLLFVVIWPGSMLRSADNVTVCLRYMYCRSRICNVGSFQPFTGSNTLNYRF